jgi:hypothetical protein
MTTGNVNKDLSPMPADEDAARRIAVPFLVINLAQILAGYWTVVECNDAQESGYAEVSPPALWHRTVEHETAREPFGGGDS